MQHRKLIAVASATALALGVAGPAAAKKPRHHDADKAAQSKVAKAPAVHTYWFQGTVAATPVAGSTQFGLNVTMANRGVHRFFNTHAGPITFSVSPTTSFVAVQPAPSGRGNVPIASNGTILQAGHKLDVMVNAPASASMAQVLATPATKITDRTAAVTPTGFNYGFRGKVVAIDLATGKLTLNINRAYRPSGPSYGLNRTVTFSFDVNTLFLNWQSGTPSLIVPTDVPAGQQVTVHVRAPRGTRVASLLTLPLWRVAHFGTLPATTTF
jgi:hypothetical protein